MPTHLFFIIIGCPDEAKITSQRSSSNLKQFKFGRKVCYLNSHNPQKKKKTEKNILFLEPYNKYIF
jgi:hypothetical protein